MLVTFQSKINKVKLEDNVAYFETATIHEFTQGQSVIITGCGSPFNGTHTVTDNEITDYVFTVNQIEPTGPGIFNFPVKDLGKTPKEFKYEEFLEYEQTIRKNQLTLDGGIFPFVISKKDYMIVGGFDTLYDSPFICDWDFFLKLDLNGIQFYRINHIHFYHFGSAATKNGKEGDKFKQTESPAAQTFIYKWGINPQLFENNSHRPKGYKVKGINF